jgi:hypothetical protein
MDRSQQLRDRRRAARLRVRARRPADLRGMAIGAPTTRYVGDHSLLWQLEGGTGFSEGGQCGDSFAEVVLGRTLRSSQDAPSTGFYLVTRERGENDPTCVANVCSHTIECVTDYDLAQRAVLGALLTAHPRLLDIDELAAHLSDVPRAREALRVLVADGLATQLGDRVGVSRAAVRFDTLARDSAPPSAQKTRCAIPPPEDSSAG